MKKQSLKKCVICGEIFEEWGNNALPVKDGQCCNECNYSKVIPARIERHRSMQK